LFGHIVRRDKWICRSIDEVVCPTLLSPGQCSLRPILSATTCANPQTAFIQTFNVSVRRLDDFLDELGIIDEQLFLKIDTQGTESEVLEGAERIFPRIVGVMVEMSTVELYRGQCLYDEMDAYLRHLGFTLWNLAPGFRDPKSARLLQFDGVYFR
jgi:Methyltransferase FkbM domain